MSDYNGWKNYETWCCNLWIDNEEWSNRELSRIIRSCKNGAETREKAIRDASTRIKDFVESDLVPDLGASFAADMLGAALCEVDWDEIAENHLDDDGRFEPEAFEEEVASV